MRELSLHFLDLTRNAIEAGANRVELEIREDPASGRMAFLVRDNGRGMAAEVAAHATDAFFTTRTTRRFGLGLALLEGTCRQCDGELRVESVLGQGTTVRGTLNYRHLDCPPLGNMGAVVQCLALEGNRVAFVYRHVVADREFVLDTREIACPLGTGELTDPRVLCWLADHVNAALQALHHQSNGGKQTREMDN